MPLEGVVVVEEGVLRASRDVLGTFVGSVERREECGRFVPAMLLLVFCAVLEERDRDGGWALDSRCSRRALERRREISCSSEQVHSQLCR